MSGDVGAYLNDATAGLPYISIALLSWRMRACMDA